MTCQQATEVQPVSQHQPADGQDGEGHRYEGRQRQPRVNGVVEWLSEVRTPPGPDLQTAEAVVLYPLEPQLEEPREVREDTDEDDQEDDEAAGTDLRPAVPAPVVCGGGEPHDGQEYDSPYHAVFEDVSYRVV